MTILSEGNLELSLPDYAEGKKFEGHGLSHCMKAVDFIVKEQDKVLFIEFKDPDNPKASQKDRKKFAKKLSSGELVTSLCSKYRDSFLYHWAEGASEKRRYYYVLIAVERLEKPLLLALTHRLKCQLPLKGPDSRRWRRRIVHECGVFDLESWNDHPLLKNYRVRRV